MTLRADNLRDLQTETFDVLVLGGGINGAVSAASLAARGVRTALIDRGDFAGVTSSNSSNLAWGGIKYLESGEIRLVNKLCRSRNELMRSFPSTVREIRFLTTIKKGFRKPPLMIYAGTLLYWAMGRFFTQAPRLLSPKALIAREPAIKNDNIKGGIEYSDSYLFDNDARFVFNFIRSALDKGAVAANYVESLGAKFIDGLWQVKARDNQTGEIFSIRARSLINSCGPWAEEQNSEAGVKANHKHLLSKGVHLIVDQISSVRRVLAFFASDGRLFFVIPMGPKTCIGTTDTRVEAPRTGVSEEDRDFILDNANQLLNLPRKLTRDDVISERCGVRPLAVETRGDSDTGDWIHLSRKHAIDVDADRKQLSIFGGKLTDCVNVGNEVAAETEQLGIQLQDLEEPWFGEPGRDIREEFLQRAHALGLDQQATPLVQESIAERLWRRYAAKAFTLLDRIEADPSQLKPVLKGTEYLRCEVEMIAEREMVTRLEDFLRRRSKIELVCGEQMLREADDLIEVCRILFGDEAEERLQEYLTTHAAAASAAEV